MNLIWLILPISAAVRIWGINFAFPLRYGHIDESVIIFYTMRFFTGDFNPNPFFDYPTLYLYLLFFCYFLFFVVGLIFGKFQHVESFIAFYNSNAVPFVLIARLLTVVFAVATIYLTYLFAKKLFNKKTGLISALFMSFGWQYFLTSHYGTTDVAATFFTLLSLYFVWSVHTKTDLKSYLLAGFFCGLSIATKYYGGIVFLAIILFGWKNKKYILYSFLATLLGFFIGCPYSIIDFAGFLERFIDRLNLIVGWGTSVPFSAISSYPRVFIDGLGYFLFFLSLAGFGFLIITEVEYYSQRTQKRKPQRTQGIMAEIRQLSNRQLGRVSDKVFFGFHPIAKSLNRVIDSICDNAEHSEACLALKRTRQNIFLLVIISIFLLFFGTWKGLSGRYTIALYPLFAIISALVVTRIKNMVLFWLVVSSFLIVSLPKIVKTDVLFSQKDTRVIAREWVLKNVPKGVRILRGPFCSEFPNDNYLVTIDWYDKIKSGNFVGVQKKFDYVITSSLHSDPAIFENNLERYGSKIYEVSKEAVGEFQNPTIKIWKL